MDLNGNILKSNNNINGNNDSVQCIGGCICGTIVALFAFIKSFIANRSKK